MDKATQSKLTIILYDGLSSVFKHPTSEVFADVPNVI